MNREMRRLNFDSLEELMVHASKEKMYINNCVIAIIPTYDLTDWILVYWHTVKEEENG